jgi:hypothetical protein
VADLHVKVEPTVFDELVGRADGRPRAWQHGTQATPAPHNQSHAAIVEDEREAELERPDTFT